MDLRSSANAEPRTLFCVDFFFCAAHIAADAAFGGGDEINQSAGGAVGKLALGLCDGGAQIFPAAKQEAIGGFQLQPLFGGEARAAQADDVGRKSRFDEERS